MNFKHVRYFNLCRIRGRAGRLGGWSRFASPRVRRSYSIFKAWIGRFNKRIKLNNGSYMKNLSKRQRHIFLLKPEYLKYHISFLIKRLNKFKTITNFLKETPLLSLNLKDLKALNEQLTRGLNFYNKNLVHNKKNTSIKLAPTPFIGSKKDFNISEFAKLNTNMKTSFNWWRPKKDFSQFKWHQKLELKKKRKKKRGRWGIALYRNPSKSPTRLICEAYQLKYPGYNTIPSILDRAYFKYKKKRIRFFWKRQPFSLKMNKVVLNNFIHRRKFWNENYKFSISSAVNDKLYKLRYSNSLKSLSLGLFNLKLGKNLGKNLLEMKSVDLGLRHRYQNIIIAVKKNLALVLVAHINFSANI